MSYSMWIMMLSCTKFMTPELIWNFDSTQFICGYDLKDGKIAVINETILGLTPTIVRNTELDLFVKWVYLCSASGEADPVVLVIAIDCLNEDEYHVLEVPGLTYSANPIEIGYIAFCKSRCY